MGKRRAWEPPLFEWSVLGPIPVSLTDHLEDEGQKLAGMAEVYGRSIHLDSALPDQAMRVILAHEWLHVVLYDAGFTKDQIEENIVQAFAVALVAREDFHANGGVPESPVSPETGEPERST